MTSIKKCTKCEKEFDQGDRFCYSQKCEHHLCKGCFDHRFSQHQPRKIKCHVEGCQQMLKFQYYKDESKEDAHFNLDRECRREVLKVYNKKAIDFDSIDQYDEYLMDIEEKIDILMTGKQKEADQLREQLQKMEQIDPAIEYRDKKKKRMNQQMKIIEQYVQDQQFNRLNRDYMEKDKAEGLNLHAENLTDTLMKKFIEDFNLDQTEELCDYDIYQLLDKKKHQEERQVQKYFERIKQSQQLFREMFKNQPGVRNYHQRAYQENREYFDILSKRVCGYYSANIVVPKHHQPSAGAMAHGDDDIQAHEPANRKRQRLSSSQSRMALVLPNTEILRISSKEPTEQNRQRRKIELDQEELYRWRCQEAVLSAGWD